MQIFLLRHGETDWNLQGRCQGITDVDLNNRGRQQARCIAKHLGSEKIAAIYSSDLKRALQTAEIIKRSHGLEVTVDSDFRELNHGAFEGLTFLDIRAAYPDFLSLWRSEPGKMMIPGGERLVDVEKRVWNGMERILKSHLSRETVVVVSHNFPILAVLCRITGTPLNNYRSFRVEPCGLSCVSHDDREGWRIVQINGTDYIAPAESKREIPF